VKQYYDVRNLQSEILDAYEVHERRFLTNIPRKKKAHVCLFALQILVVTPCLILNVLFWYER